MVYYVIQADGTNDYIITDSEEKAIKIYDKMVDDNPEWQCLHFSTWEKEDPEGFESWDEVLIYLNDFNREEEE